MEDGSYKYCHMNFLLNFFFPSNMSFLIFISFQKKNKKIPCMTSSGLSFLFSLPRGLKRKEGANYQGTRTPSIRK